MSKRIVSGIMLTVLLVSILIMAFYIQPARAGGTVSGKVTESDGMTPIVGALVEALQEGDIAILSATTGGGGLYSLSLPVGLYKMRASGNSYITNIKPVINVTSGIITVNFNLSRGQMLVFDDFIGTSLNASKWNSHLTGIGSIGIANATGEPTKFSCVGLSSGYGGAGSATITSKLNASLNSTIIFEGRVSAYWEAHWYPGVYGDKQPRGLRVGTDPNNAIEFISYARDTVEARTVASGIATVSQHLLPSGKMVGDWNLTYRIEANSTQVKFYVNNVLIATHTTNIPTGPLNIYMGTNYDGYGNVPVSADYLYMALGSDVEKQVVALVNGSRVYNYDLDLENVAFKYPAFRSSGSEGASETANWIKEKFESFGLETWLEPFEFTTWNLSSQPSLVIDDDGDQGTTGDQTTINSFRSAHYSWPTPEGGTFADLVILPLPDADNRSDLATKSINMTEWNAIDTTGKIVLVGYEVGWCQGGSQAYVDKIFAQPPAAIIRTWSYDWMSFVPDFFSSGGGRPLGYPYYWNLGIPMGSVYYQDGLWIRNRENTIDVSASFSIESDIDTGNHYNVVGKISGYKNPEKLVIISGHYDTIMSGAFCDNGAGTAGVIELAKVFAEAVEEGLYRPRYTLLFIAFAAEELGLVGSINYVKQHKNEMANIIAVLNLDCIGSDELYVTETDPTNGFDLDELILEAADDLGITAIPEEPGGSDQEAFRSPSWANDIYYWYWSLEANIADAIPVNSSAMLISYPLIYYNEWDMGVPGWIHTSYDNSTSTTTLNWVEVEDLENHIKVAALTVMRISPSIPVWARVVPDDYSTIQGAINVANTGDTIYVRDGTYYENVVVNRTISLIGENRNMTIIDGRGIGTVVHITNDNVNISSFTVRNSGWPNSGIYLDCVIHCNVLSNIIADNGYGIMLGGSNNILSANTAINNQYSIWLGPSSANNTLSGNTATNSGVGIQLAGCSHNVLSENTAINNTYGAFELYTASNNNLSRNTAINNKGVGFGLYYSSHDNVLSGNTATNNVLGIWLVDSSDNSIFHNNFINNIDQAIVSGEYRNVWDDDYPSGGNYWSDYADVDLFSGPYQNVTGSDGIGDAAHVIDANNWDNYPLMKLYGGLYDIGITSITPFKTVVGEGYSLNINVKIVNYGVKAETINIAAYANTTVIAIFTNIVLTSRNSATITFLWNTPGFAKGNYAIKATADTVPGETDTTDNTFTNGVVTIAMPGDLNADGTVDIFDLVIVAAQFGRPIDPPLPIEDPNADVNEDGVVDIFDLVIAAANFGKTDP